MKRLIRELRWLLAANLVGAALRIWIDNLSSIEAHDPKFAVVYRQEKAMLLEVMKAGDATLLEIALGVAKT